MHVTLAGIGSGAACSLTEQALKALADADLIIGARRLLDALPPSCPSERLPAVKAEEILRVLLERLPESAVIVFSGDSGFYSGARMLIPLLADNGIPCELLPGVSSVQMLAARLGEPWQDWRLVSAHGVDIDPVTEARHGSQTFFLTGGKWTPEAICGRLTEAGLGGLHAVVGEALGLPGERIVRGTAAELSEQRFSSLSVLLTEAAPLARRRTPGWPDSDFVRGEGVPMTKQEVRAVILGKLALTPSDVCWDVGAGTGSVSVEMAACCRETWAIERKPEACELIRANKERFHAHNLYIREGTAPEALSCLPRPDAVFVGGSSGNLAEILSAVHCVNSDARICVSAIALETLSEAVGAFKAMGRDFDVTQISVSRSRAAGSLHLMLAQNPVYLIVSAGESE